MASRVRGLMGVLVVFGCAGDSRSTAVPVSLRATGGPAVVQCAEGCHSDQVCGRSGECIADRAVADVGGAPRYRGARIMLGVGGALTGLGVVTLAVSLALNARYTTMLDPEDDGDDGPGPAVGPWIGGVMAASGLVLLTIGGIKLADGRRADAALRERPTARLLPTFGASPRGGHGGLALRVEF